MEHIHAFVADVCSTNSLSMVKGDAARIAVAIGGIRDPSAVLDVARPMVERRREAGRVLRQAMADAGLPGGAEAEIQAITKDYGNREPPTADNAATIVSAIIARLKGRREAVEFHSDRTIPAASCRPNPICPVAHRSHPPTR